MLALIEFLISKIKGRDFKFDKYITLLIVIYLVASKIARLFRGMFFYQKIMYLGRNTKIIQPKHLKFKSNNVEIGSDCIINCLSHEGIFLGDNFKLGDFSRVIVSGTLRDLGKGVAIGDNVSIGEFAYVGGAGGVSIGSDCIIGQYFSVHPENHLFGDRNKNIREQGVTRKGVIIGKNCWVGAKVTFCDGAQVGDNCVVAAGAVVNKSFGDNLVIGGVPAKVIKSIYD